MAFTQSRAALATSAAPTVSDINSDRQQESNTSKNEDHINNANKTEDQATDDLISQADIDGKSAGEDLAANSSVEETTDTLNELSLSSTRILKDHPKNKKEVEEEDALALTMALSYSEVNKDAVSPIYELETVTNLILKGNCKVRSCIRPSDFTLVLLILTIFHN